MRFGHAELLVRIANISRVFTISRFLHVVEGCSVDANALSVVY
jgi:hypothetical protein